MVNQVIHRVNIFFSTEGTESEDEDTASNASTEISQSCFQDLRPKHQTDKTGTPLSQTFITSVRAGGRVRGTKKNDSKPIGQFLREMARETLTRFSRKQIKSFTMNFHSKIGQGGFGIAYKGLMPNGVYVAVKLTLRKGHLAEEFMAEVRILGRTYHKNIVRLIGYCVDGDVRALVYEYVPNGSLGQYLLSNRNDTNWVMLQHIAVETAKGISYLHEECPEVIIHLDVKPSNILLDANFSPKLADFGLAAYEKDQQDDMVHGTYGYLDPAFCQTGYATCKSDVYGFGMVLFDILGRYNLKMGDYLVFPEQVWDKFKTGNLEYLKEPEGRMSMAALWCIQNKPEDRPSMSTVVKILRGDIEATQPPYPFSSFSKTYSYTSTLSASFSDRPSMSTVVKILRGDIEATQPPYPFSSFSKTYSYTSTASASFSSGSGEITKVSFSSGSGEIIEVIAVQGGPDYERDSVLLPTPTPKMYGIEMATSSDNLIMESKTSIHTAWVQRAHPAIFSLPNRYMKAFPAKFVPYIQFLKDVEGNGNCGFRALADLLGMTEIGWLSVREDLISELQRHWEDYSRLCEGYGSIHKLKNSLEYYDINAPVDNWMDMPDMGHIIASCYNVVLVHISLEQCLTFLPLRSPPLPEESHEIISIGFVNGNHFVRLDLKQGCPLPSIAERWHIYRHPCARGWERSYTSRIKRFEELVIGDNVALRETPSEICTGSCLSSPPSTESI